MSHISLIKNLTGLIFLIIFISFFITTSAFAQVDEPTSAETPAQALISVHNYKNIVPAYYEYYNVPELDPAISRALLVLSASLAVIGGLFVTGAMQWAQDKVSEVPAFSYVSYGQSPILRRLNLKEDYDEIQKRMNRNQDEI